MNQEKMLQYKQIDFLRLFKLSRELGIVQRKRKMPTQYDKATYINSSCSKLFKSFLTGVFEDAEIVVDNRANHYEVPIRGVVGEKLRYISERQMFLSQYEEYREVLIRFRIIMEDESGFINGAAQYWFRKFIIIVTPNYNGRFRSVIAGLDNTSHISRPREEYYRAAKACLNYKNKWNEHIGFLCDFVDREEENIERRMQEELERQRTATEARRVEREQQELRHRQAREQQATERERLRVEQESLARTENERRAAVAAQAQQALQEQRRRAQDLFNQALVNRRGP